MMSNTKKRLGRAGPRTSRNSSKSKTKRILDAIKKDQKERFPEGSLLSNKSVCTTGLDQSASSFGTTASSSRSLAASFLDTACKPADSFRKKQCVLDTSSTAHGTLPTAPCRRYDREEHHGQQFERTESEQFYLEGLLVLAPDRKSSLEDLMSCCSTSERF